MVTFWSQPSDRDLRRLPDIPMLCEGFLESGHGIVLIHQVEVRVEVEGDANVGVAEHRRGRLHWDTGAAKHRRIAMPQVVEADGGQARALGRPLEGTVDSS